MSASSGAIEAIERILNRGGDAGGVLRAVVDAVHERGVPWVAIRTEGHEVSAGSAAPARSVPIVYGGEHVGELEAATDDEAFLERVATLVSAHVAAPRRGEPWSP